ncbi:MAG TPA: energy transducer TonB [Thermoanaerobaculia bacterium]
MSLLLMLWLSTMTVVPKNVILVKGAIPAASDSSTPVPEGGTVSAGRYRNAYFGLSYPIPAGWKEQPAGPPPSDSGIYVLTQFALYDADQQRLKAHVLVTAEDLFFSAAGAADAKDVLASIRHDLPARYEFDNGPDEVTIAGRKFHRLAYTAPRTGLQWRILSTDTRCHALTFTFTGVDKETLDAGERSLNALSLSSAAPACMNDYASGDNIIEKTDPLLATHRFNTIPVRVLIDTNGRVKHIHLLSAFPEQSQAIIAALRTWRFKPYRINTKAVPIETGIVFGMPRMATKTTSIRR